MAYKLSTRSQERLMGIEPELKEVVYEAIKVTKIDFGVIEGLRTEEKQKQLVESGASLTMKSKHLEGRAVDLMAYIGGRGSWELNVYDEIADAMKEAAVKWTLQFVGVQLGLSPIFVNGKEQWKMQ